MFRICRNCAKDLFLKNIIENNRKKGTCSLCNKLSSYTLETSEKKFINTITFLIRYYYSEWEYHSKLGGDSIEYLLSHQNPIFSLPKKCDEDILSDFLMSFINDIYDNDKVHIITAYGRDIYNHIVNNAVSVGSSSIIESISQELKYRNYFLVEPKYEDYFKRLIPFITREIDSGCKYFRARIGATKSASNFIFEKNTTEDYFTPLKDKEIGAPPIATASSGRANRPGVSYLYLATDIETSVSEIRSHPSEIISVAQFISKNKLNVADFSYHKLSEDLISDEGSDLLEFIINIEKVLSTMATPRNNSTFYGITQFITEMLRKLEFDGILFKSSVGSGKNLVVFDPQNFEWIPGSGHVYKITKVEYSMESCLVFDEKEHYDRIYD